jgi:hypothetical protein
VLTNNTIYPTYYKLIFKFLLIDNSTLNFIPKITASESIYSSNILKQKNKQFNASYNLNNLYKYTMASQLLNRYDFNLYINMVISKEQRWLNKNSLLTESLTKNSNLFTQSKKLLGLNPYSNTSTSKNLWLPTKLSNLNSTESLSYINNSINSLYPSLLTKNHNYNILFNQDNSSFLLNLNFFENSRL